VAWKANPRVCLDIRPQSIIKSGVLRMFTGNSLGITLSDRSAITLGFAPDAVKAAGFAG
jgi:hypothetical protein